MPETPNATTAETTDATERNNRSDPLASFRNVVELIESAVQNGETVNVSLFRVSDRGQRSLAGKVDGAEFDITAIGERFGSGRYLVQPRIGGKWITATTVEVDAPRSIERAHPQPTVPTAAPGGLSVEFLFQQMMAQQAAAANLTNSIITALLSRPADSLKLADILPLMKQTSPVGDLVAAVREMQELVPSGGGGSDSGTSDLAAIASLVGPVLAAQQTQQKANHRMTTTATNRPRPLVRKGAPPLARGQVTGYPQKSDDPLARIVQTIRAFAGAGLSAKHCAKAIVDASRLERKTRELLGLVSLAGSSPVGSLVDQLAAAHPSLSSVRDYAVSVEAILRAWARALASRQAPPPAKTAAPVAQSPGRMPQDDDDASDDELDEDDELDDIELDSEPGDDAEDPDVDDDELDDDDDDDDELDDDELDDDDDDDGEEEAAR